MNKNIGDEPIWVITHIHMEISQGNFLCSYLYLNKQKCNFFFFLFCSTKSENEGRTGPSWDGVCREEWGGGGSRGTHVCIIIKHPSHRCIPVVIGAHRW
jgi:hypothetical protein